MQVSKDDPSLQQRDILEFSEDSAYVFNDDISHERQEANVVSGNLQYIMCVDLLSWVYGLSLVMLCCSEVN